MTFRACSLSDTLNEAIRENGRRRLGSYEYWKHPGKEWREGPHHSTARRGIVASSSELPPTPLTLQDGSQHERHHLAGAGMAYGLHLHRFLFDREGTALSPNETLDYKKTRVGSLESKSV